jgi:hypothetical protein
MKQNEKLGKRTFRNYSKYRRLLESKDGYCVCFTCGRIKEIGEMQLGHFLHRGRRSFTKLDFMEENTNPQCVHCNYYNADSKIMYTKKLMSKYGTDIIDKLKLLKETLQPLTNMELEYMNKFYLKEKKRLEKDGGGF